MSIHWFKSEKSYAGRGLRPGTTGIRRFWPRGIEPLQVASSEGPKPFEVNESHGNFGCVLPRKFFGLLRDRFGNVARYHNRDRSRSARQQARIALRLQNGLREKRDDPVLSSFRGPLDRDDVLLPCALGDNIRLNSGFGWLHPDLPSSFAKHVADQMPDASLFVRRRMGSPEDIARLAHPADHFHSS